VGTAIVAAIKSEVASHPDYSVIVTGHSLGGGIAAVATSSFIAQGIFVSKVYTYGEPRNGDSSWVNYISGQISEDDYHRVTNYNDGVPQIPPRILDYAHHGKEFWLSRASDNTASTTLECGVESAVSILAFSKCLFRCAKFAITGL
jgi:feruloyl esterase